MNRRYLEVKSVKVVTKFERTLLLPDNNGIVESQQVSSLQEGGSGDLTCNRDVCQKEAVSGNILTWSAIQNLNWDVIFLLGGGFALSKVCSKYVECY